MPIYTRAGDGGTTCLAGGLRLSKADPRVEAYGAVDEADCAVGLARAAVVDDIARNVLLFAQHRLGTCASLLAGPLEKGTRTAASISDADVEFLETAIDRFVESAPPLGGFILPGGSESAARLHVARSVVRRAERRVIAAGLCDEAVRHVVRFLNRLSDLLFVLARDALANEGISEDRWDPEAAPPPL